MELQFISQAIQETILEIAHKLHRHPELSYLEFGTTSLLKDILEKLGMELPPQQPATGVIGLLRGGLPGPTIALRADIDALPIEEAADHEIRSEISNVMHACGHDFHTAGLIGAAIALSSRRETLPGNILFIFQPAEEQCGGAEEVIATGIFESYPPDAFFSLHVMPDIPYGQVDVREGPLMAAQGCFRIQISGKGGHGAMPHLSMNPILTAAQIIDGLQLIRSRWADPVQPFSLSVCSIHGGSACNIIPDDVTLEGTFRYALESYGEAVKEEIRRIAGSIAHAHGCTAECSFFREIFPLINDARLARLARKAAADVYGEENLLVREFRMISEDFGFYRRIAPIFMFHVGVGNPEGTSAGLHNSRFRVPDDAGPLCAELLTGTALSALDGLI
ncbi:MAG: amidohydrolase [Clostridia bacterium]|nr:amidohydrolase [Clostridia bacterium]